MLYHFLADHEGLLNIFRYVTFRAGGAIITALIVSFILGPYIIQKLKKKQNKNKDYVREDLPDSHLKKAGTPSMGGVLILLSIVISTLLWADLRNGYVWAVLFITLGFGLIGFADDYLKIHRKSSKGVSGKVRLLAEFMIAGAGCAAIIMLTSPDMHSLLAFPFLKNVLLDLGWFYLIFAAVVIVGAANAVNLTDGLDGLAIFPVMIAAAVFGVIAYLVGHALYASYLYLPKIPESSELVIFCGALVGAALGFLWFNAPPAMVFMGDTGSLSMGGALGAVSVVTKHEIVLAIVGGLFVMEAVSVIMQVASFKLTGKRIFKMAPIHHHFEKKGWAESTIVVRFWIIAVILGLIGLATLKLR